VPAPPQPAAISRLSQFVIPIAVLLGVVIVWLLMRRRTAA
jgi:uncharacterized Tic20 family protein